jgi:glutaredoxin
MPVELFATSTCEFCAEVREQLDMDGIDYVVHDVETDPVARARLTELTGPNAIVPVLVEDGRVAQVGLRGRGCYVGAR